MVEIIPKPAARPPLWLSFLSYFSIVLLIATITSFFVLNYLVKKSEETLSRLETALAEEKTPSESALEKEVFGYQKKIEDMAFLLDSRLEISRTFEILEKNTHPKVWLTDFELNIAENKIKMSGLTDSFQSLGQQVLILKENQLIRNLNLSKVSIKKEGNISFTFEIILNSQVFKSNE